MATTTTTQPQYIYGSGKDLATAKATYGNNSNYNFIDTSASGFDPNSMQSGAWMLGGNKVNTNVSDSMLQTKGIHRLSGADAAGTQSALSNAMSNGISAPNSNMKYVYGSGKDLQNAQGIFRPGNGYQLVDVSSPNFDPANMQKGGIMLGGSGVNTNITDDMLGRLGMNRVYGQNADETANNMENYYWDSQKPTSPTNTPLPTYTPFAFNGDMQTYLDQAQNMLKPQYDLAVKNINENYDSNIIPQANNDTLARGLARSSYAGNRIDQANKARTNDLTNADMQQHQQVNNMAMQNYNTAYDRAYQGWKDNTANNWQMYNAQNAANQQNFGNQMDLYKTNRGDYWQNKDYKQQQDQWNWQKIKDQNEENWKKQNQTNWQAQFDYQKSQDEFNNNLKSQQLALSQAAAASRSSGGSKGGGSGRSSGSKSSSGSSSKLSTSDKSNIKTEVWNQLQSEEKEGLGRNYLMKYKDDIINSVGESYFNTLVADADQHAEQGGTPSGWQEYKNYLNNK